MTFDLALLSKTTAHALRHEPWLYGLELDDDGWVEIEALVAALRAVRDEWSAVDASAVTGMVASSPKHRYEIDRHRIRARYGHSTVERIRYPASQPPEVLFHGTSPEVVAQILEEGLTPRARQYVHLSVDAAMARTVGRRKAAMPALLAVQSLVAHHHGIRFYQGNALVWLADSVPPAFMTVWTT